MKKVMKKALKFLKYSLQIALLVPLTLLMLPLLVILVSHCHTSKEVKVDSLESRFENY